MSSSPFYYERANHALSTNNFDYSGTLVAIHITNAGSDFAYMVTAVMIVTCLGILAFSLRKPQSDRVFHYLLALLNLIGSIMYFIMASNLGWAPIVPEFIRTRANVAGDTRQIFYARYVGWFLCISFVIISLQFTAGMAWHSIVYEMFLGYAFVIAALVGTVVHSSYKWGFYCFSVVAMLGLFYELLWEGRRHALPLGKTISNAYTILICWICVCWLLYPICWGCSEGGNYIAPDSEMVFYGILDLMTMPFFAIVFLWLHRNIDPASLGLSLKGVTGEEFAAALHNEKVEAANATSTGVTAPAAANGYEAEPAAQV